MIFFTELEQIILPQILEQILEQIMQPQKTSNNQSNLEEKEQNQRYQSP